MVSEISGTHAKSVLLLCVDSYEDENIKGRLFGINQECMFRSLIQLLKAIDQLLDKQEAAKPYNNIRSFNQSDHSLPELPSDITDTARRGNRATFVINIVFRRNASWQGTVAWCERDREESFRSVLELIFLLDSAMKLST